MTDELAGLLAEQARYYRERAGEYEDWWFRRGRYDRGADANARWFAEVAEVQNALERFRPAGEVLERRAAALDVPVARTADWRVEDLHLHARGSRFHLSPPGLDISCPLAGEHQVENAVTAARALYGLGMPAAAIEEGIARAEWPGRLELVSGSPETIVDGAHNPAGAWALRSALSDNFPDRPLTLVFGAMRDKAIQEMADILFPLAEQVIVTHIDNPRAAGTDELLEAGSRTGAAIHAEPNVVAALRDAFDQTPEDRLIVVTGSIFLVGDTMKELGIRP